MGSVNIGEGMGLCVLNAIGVFLCSIFFHLIVFCAAYFFISLFRILLCLVTGAHRLFVPKKLVLLQQLRTKWKLLH